jgi:hypothetical protein
VSLTSQPPCIAHLEPGGPVQDGAFSAAESSCTGEDRTNSQ